MGVYVTIIFAASKLAAQLDGDAGAEDVLFRFFCSFFPLLFLEFVDSLGSRAVAMSPGPPANGVGSVRIF